MPSPKISIRRTLGEACKVCGKEPNKNYKRWGTNGKDGGNWKKWDPNNPASDPPPSQRSSKQAAANDARAKAANEKAAKAEQQNADKDRYRPVPRY